jgi:hypothetical protein
MLQMKEMAESCSQGFRVYYHDKVGLLQLFLTTSELPNAAVNSFAGLRRFFSILQLDLHITTCCRGCVLGQNGNRQAPFLQNCCLSKEMFALLNNNHISL